ncbi:sugar dehydrogenase complex small subunit [Pragia fontium]|uniref:Membrane bound FAD containing D-sorbitol dehydrogenase n=1 Tax=Pragia fontium DSM 5563 = ATCC 49100 TaxID=1122977 RepID=A0AAJ4WCJ7_9GAMM|nr:sugar dehydrogenase complex small subunit [Pragia fontium]AKJ43571.1 hypothetical protein QQ39_17160 [Pragia fontium]SFD21933.1 Membrane bound FAD containing D-sorbitol dehydrogenase [Pragia fontium DSM 5563 = ATCC 49100]VEJ56960.1 Membrane bound FAD containing D-sorbitol dehydrogenase [Pragia fontium]
MLSRRNLLISGAALTGFAVLRSALSWASEPNESSDSAIFFKLSLLLTSRKHLSPVVAQRALHGLVTEDAQFLQNMRQLSTAMTHENITSADQLYGHPLMNGSFGDTAKKILSAWYLGYTGTPVPLRASDSTRFVTYTDALAYAPTLDATVIPTYSRGRTNYWVQPPVTIKND